MTEQPYNELSGNLVINGKKYTLKVATTGAQIKDIQFHPSVENELASAATRLPGVSKNVKYPCSCYTEVCSGYTPEAALFSIITHLNDADRWSRGQIADWLESLDIDMEFR